MPNRPIAVVTGANRGIGLAIAQGLGAAGYHVVLTARELDAARRAAETLRAAGHSAEAAALDIRDYASCAALQAQLSRDRQRVDALVNNAGILIDPSGVALTDLPLDVLRETIDTNLYGALRVTQALTPLLVAAGNARVVNLSSGLGQLAEMGSGTPAYRISKTALNALTRILAAELAPHGVKVNAMCPGWVRTSMGGESAPRTPEQGADTAIWLATLPDDGPTGGFFRDRLPIPW